MLSHNILHLNNQYLRNKKINHQLVGNNESNKIKNNQGSSKIHSQKNQASAQNSQIRFLRHHR